MKTFIRTLALFVLLAASKPSWAADDLEQLAGKWTSKHTNDEGQTATFVLEIKKNAFKFRIIGPDKEVRLYAAGSLKLEKFGPFSGVRFYDIKAGQSESELDPVDDTRAAVYVLDGDTWTMASNFDRLRENEKPRADTYTRAGRD